MWLPCWGWLTDSVTLHTFVASRYPIAHPTDPPGRGRTYPAAPPSAAFALYWTVLDDGLALSSKPTCNPFYLRSIAPTSLRARILGTQCKTP